VWFSILLDVVCFFLCVFLLFFSACFLLEGVLRLAAAWAVWVVSGRYCSRVFVLVFGFLVFVLLNGFLCCGCAMFVGLGSLVGEFSIVGDLLVLLCLPFVCFVRGV